MVEEIERLRKIAIEFHSANRLNEAEHVYQQILLLHHADIEARHMLAVLKQQQGDSGQAFKIIDALAAEAPDHAGIRTHRGVILSGLGRRDEAMVDFDLALALKPGNPATLLYLGNLLLETGRFTDALGCYDQLLSFIPDYDEAWFRRGSALWMMDRFEEALASYSNAININPGHVAAQFNYGTTLLKLDRYKEAVTAFERVELLAPGNAYVLGGLAGAVSGGCDLARWEKYQLRVDAAVRSRRNPIAPLVLMPFSDDAALRRICSEVFAADRVPVPAAPLWAGQCYGHKRIRIAYLSSDFRQHATAQLIAGLIECHDRSRFEVTAVSFGRDDGSAMRARLVRAFDHFVDVRARSDLDAAKLLYEGQIDIAVDLKGHTEESRPGILAHCPCPVQVGYLGFPGTIGAPWLDYILADAMVLPFADQPHYAEKIVHLPGCYQVNDSQRAIGETCSRAESGLPEKGFVFCCFNAAWKIAPTLFDIWMRLLADVKDSVLWLLDDNSSAKANLIAAAVGRGIDPTRLIFAPRVAVADHLARHKLADLFLDTLPYNAHTTASDALWAGLPLLTCRGNSFDGRVAASLLKALGLDELITETLAGYEALALALARDQIRLAALRGRLAANRLASPLFDTDRFREGIEAAYLRMVKIARRGDAPRSFSVGR